MLSHARQLQTVVVELGYGDLVVLGRITDFDVRRLKQLLLGFEDLLQELRGHHVVRWHEVLAVRTGS